jgi:hypothetical protein
MAVDGVGEVMSPYVGSSGERGRRRNERSWRGRGGTRRRRRRSRKRGVRLWRRGWGSGERERRSDEGWRDYVRGRGLKVRG